MGAQGKTRPTREYITNGGVETGDLTGWTQDPFAEISSAEAHSGTYSAYLGYQYGISQTFTAVAGSDIITFELWLKVIHLWGSEPYPMRTTIFYDDATDDAWDESINYDVWTQVDLLAHVNTSKNVNKLGVTNYLDSWDDAYLDDVTLIGY